MYLFASRAGTCLAALPQAQGLNHSLRQGLKRSLHLTNFQEAGFLGPDGEECWGPTNCYQETQPRNFESDSGRFVGPWDFTPFMGTAP